MTTVTHHLVGSAEIADMLGGVSRQRVTQIVSKPGFPKPVVTLAMGQVWKRADIDAWIAKHRP